MIIILSDDKTLSLWCGSLSHAYGILFTDLVSF